MTVGKVFLVGAGPGEPSLITVKGSNLIKGADVIIYDRLCSPRLLAFAPSTAERIYAGKTPDKHTLPQDEINRILVRKALEGKRIVRLKGGDPSVFGRVGEEIDYLRKHGISYEVVPGVTSAVSVPMYAGIPVTHRGIATSFAVITGHEDPQKESSWINWDGIAKGVDTTIFLMGVGRLAFIVDQLLLHGKSDSTPVALIRWGTWAEQETITGTLADIVKKVESANFRNPAVIVVGDVVNLREQLAWVEKKPLFGKRVMVTRACSQASKLAELIEEYGGEAFEHPVIQLRPPHDWNPVDAELQQIDTYDWIIFTSANGVTFFLERMRETAIDIRRLRGKIAAVGTATEEALRNYGLITDLIPKQFVGEALFSELEKHVASGQKILLPRGNMARNALPDALLHIGCDVTEIDVYVNELVADHGEEAVRMLKEGNIHIITFTSSSTVKNFIQIMTEQKQDLQEILKGVTVASIGPITTETALKLGLKVDVTAESHTINGLLESLIHYFSV